MAAVLKWSGRIFGVYTGLTVINIGSHWFNFKKVNSWQLPQNNATKPLSAEQLKDENEMNRRADIEQSIISLFAVKATADDMQYVDDNVEFEDPVGSRVGKEGMGIVLLNGGKLISDHEMKDLEITRYSNSFTLTYDQSLIIFGLSIKSLPTTVYCELDEENKKVTKCYDLWYGRPFFHGFGVGTLIRQINGKLIYDLYLRNV